LPARSGLGRRTGAVHGRGAVVRRGRLHARRAFGTSALDGGAPFDENGSGLPPNCQVQRVQINDDYGWRVRDMVVCPHNTLESKIPKMPGPDLIRAGHRFSEKAGPRA